MERLTGLDATFLYAETSSVHMHTLKVAIVDPLPGSGDNTFERFREELASRLHLLPRFRRRIVETPFSFHRPVWIEDPNFDIDFHLRRIAVPSPGGRRELDAVIAEIASHPLYRKHPLWEIWRVEGLADGGTAYVAKVHHAVADGIASAHLLANVMGTRPEQDFARPPSPWSPEPVPSKTRLLLDALRDHVRRVWGLAPLIARTLGGFWRLIWRRLRGAPAPSMPYQGPSTSLNRQLSPARSFATVDVALSDVRAIKSELDVTLNDVVLSIVAGALQRYLARREERPTRSLVAAVPVATTDDEQAGRLVGNRLSNLFTSLRTDIADPVARTHAIHAAMVAAREANEQLGSSIMQEWSEYDPPWLHAWFARLLSRLEVTAKYRPPANAIVSNVRGPDRPLYIAGMKLRSLYSVGPIVDGIGINITAWSYADELAFTVLANRTAVPDAHEVTACLSASLTELAAAVGLQREPAEKVQSA